MTDADKATFAQAFARLAVADREKDLDAIAVSVYFTGLRDLDIEFNVAAADQLATSSAWFPKLAEWRAAAVKIEADRIDEQRAFLRKLPSPLCSSCDDTGWSRDADDRVSRCDCRNLRRLEVLGRRPWPALPESTRAESSDGTIGRDEASALTTTILRRTGRTDGPRDMEDSNG